MEARRGGGRQRAREERRETLSKSPGSGSMAAHCLFRFRSGRRLYPDGLSDANPGAKSFEASQGRSLAIELEI